MNALESLILGIVQGVCEWIPISSSGQAFLFMTNLLGIEPAKAFSLSLFAHLGSLLAITIILREEIARIAVSLRDPIDAIFWRSSSKGSKLLSFLIYSSLMSGAVGLPVYLWLIDYLGELGDEANALVGLALIATGAMLYLGKSKLGSRGEESISILDSILAGGVQGLAIIPGFSRSGGTVAILLLSGYEAESALRLSFLMAIPALAFGSILGASSLGYLGSTHAIIVIISSFLASYLSARILLETARKIRFDLFCFLLGILALISSIPLPRAA